jgi:uridine kinase
MTVAPYLVGVAGGSGAGKTALVQAIAAALGPPRVALLVHDAYYRDRSDVEPAGRRQLNFDVPPALDQELFRAHLGALRRGDRITPPRYCFATHCRLEPGEPLEPREVVLVEGILLLHDPLVRDLLDLSIYVDAPDGLRLARRIARDTAERGRTAESVLEQYRATVLPAHGRLVEPTKVWADLVLINTGRLEAIAEVAAAVIRARLARRQRAAGVRAA